MKNSLGSGLAAGVGGVSLLAAAIGFATWFPNSLETKLLETQSVWAGVYDSDLGEMLSRYLSVAFNEIVLNPLFYGLIATIFFLERVIPADRQQRVLSQGMYQDFAWYLLNGTMSVVLFPVYMAWLHFIYIRYFEFMTLDSVQSLPTSYRIIMALVLTDFLQWFNHILRHKVRIFWLFHAVHHSQRELNLFSSHRLHPGDRLIAITIMCFPLFMCDLAAVTNVYIVMFEKWYLRVYHANLRANFGFFKYLLVTPQSHHIHHSATLKHRDSNFGYIFSLWDHLAGTQYKNYNEYVATGVDDAAFPLGGDLKGLTVLKNLWAQFIYPFRQLNSKA